MAIIKRSDAEVTPPSERAEGSIAVEEAPANQQAPPTEQPAQQAEAAPAPPPAAPAERERSMTETLPAALEPELRRIIDTAVARVAAIELDAIREARELTQRSEQEARESLKFALDRAFNLIATLELLAATVGGMAEALKVELDDAIGALRKVPEPESELSRELAQAPPPVATEPEPEPQPALAAAAPEPEAEAAPEPALDAKPEEASKPQAAKSEPEPVAAQPEVAEQPEVAAAEEPPAAEEPRPSAEEPQPAAGQAPGSNGYSAAERQARSLADAVREEPAPQPDPEPQRAGDGFGSEDGKPAVPARRRGLMRRLFTK